MKKSLMFLATLFAAAQPAFAEVRGEAIDYVADGVTMKGYIAYDDAFTGKRPGVLVVHEWWGHNDYARKRANMLAEMGYTALAVDMFGEGKTADHPKDAGAFAGAVSKNMPMARARFDAALATLHKHPTVEATQTAALGYCFGGGLALNMARQGVDLKGVASFHGTLSSKMPAEPGTIKARIAVFTGADDPMIPAAQVDGFRQEMDKAGVQYSVVSYAGVKHSFTNPAADEFAKKFGMPVGYDAQADRSSWADTAKFLSEIFATK